MLAKEPRPGHSKTRLTPPLSPAEAAEVAEAALRTTLAAARACSAQRLVLALDGAVGEWLGEGFEVIPQRGAGQAERLGAAFADVPGPAVLIGMDSPQVSPELIDLAFARIAAAPAGRGARPRGRRRLVGNRDAPARPAGIPRRGDEL